MLGRRRRHEEDDDEEKGEEVGTSMSMMPSDFFYELRSEAPRHYSTRCLYRSKGQPHHREASANNKLLIAAPSCKTENMVAECKEGDGMD